MEKKYLRLECPRGKSRRKKVHKGKRQDIKREKHVVLLRTIVSVIPYNGDLLLLLLPLLVSGTAEDCCYPFCPLFPSLVVNEGVFLSFIMEDG